MTALLLAVGIGSLPTILLYVLAICLFLGGLWLILSLFPPTKPYANTVTLIALVFVALYVVLYLAGAL